MRNSKGRKSEISEELERARGGTGEHTGDEERTTG